jgi:hypothetical protein
VEASSGAPPYRRWLLVVALSLTVLAVSAVPSAQPHRTTTEVASRAPEGDGSYGVSDDTTSTALLEPTTVPTAPTTTAPPVAPKPRTTLPVAPASGINADGLWIRSLDGTLRAFPHPLDGGRFSSAWTPDSQSLYVSRTYAGEKWSLTRVDMSGSTEELAAPEWIEPIVLSDSGRYLLKNRGSLTGEVVDLSSGVARKLDDPMLTWLPHADVLVTPKLKTIPLDGSAPGQIATPSGYVPGYETFISDDHIRVVSIESSAIAWFDVGGELRRVKTDAPIDTYAGCAFQRDGSHVACAAHQADGSWVTVVDLDSGDVRTIARAWAVAYSPSGQLTYAEETDPSFRFMQRVMIESPTGPVELLPAGRVGTMAATPMFMNWSPDGRQLAVEITPYSRS